MSDLGIAACIKRPLAVVQAVRNRMEGAVECAAVHQEVEKHFRSVFADQASLQQVPYLSSDSADLPSFQGLVRFRAMVQDMLNPEYFLGAYQLPDGRWGITHYSDAPPGDLQLAVATKLWERRPLYCTPVPAEAAWAATQWQGAPSVPATPPTSDRAKRARELDPFAGTDASEASMDEGPDGGCDVGSACKDQAAAAPAPKLARVHAPDAAAGPGSGDSTALADAAAPAPNVQPAVLPGDCLVYVYGDAEQFKLHDVVEVLGCVSLLPELAAPDLGAAGEVGGMDIDAAWAEEMAVTHPPTSRVPRVHALLICAQRPRQLPPAGLRKPLALDGGDVGARAALLAGLRERAVGLIALSLGGDRLAAEYVLLTAMGRVFHRAEGAPTGLVSLNLWGCPAGAHADGSACARALHVALSALLPAVALLPVSIGALNTGGRWGPKKDHASGRLLRGKLQLAAGTLALLDECGMEAGELSEDGVANLRAAAALLQQQQLSLDFEFYQTTLGTDVPCVVLSAGRSLLKDCISVAVRLQPTGPLPAPEAVAAAADAWSNELGEVRELLGRAKLTETQLPQALVPELSAQYATLHAQDPAFNTFEFNNCITMAKLLAMSWTHEVFTMGDWRALRALEAERVARG